MSLRDSAAPRSALIGVALALGLSLGPAALGQPQAQRSEQGTSRAAGRNAEDEPAQSTSIDAQTGKIINEAIELMNADDNAAAEQKIGTLRLDRLSPYERGRVEQILFSIAFNQEQYDEARGHLQKAIDSGGLNAQEIDSARYQSAQLYMQEEKWRQAAAAFEEWFKTASNPNSAAYYYLAAAYYQQEDFARALAPAKKAVELMDPAKPNESWLSMLSALYLNREEYREAIPVMQQLIEAAPDKKSYWVQLSQVYVQTEDYARGLAVMQLAYNEGLLTEDSDLRRLADLLVFNDVPYRGAQILEAAIAKNIMTLDDKLYEKLANCWIVASELDRAIAPLERAAALSSTGDLFVRLGEVHVQREDWAAAIAAVERGVDKGQLKDPASAQLMLGIAHYRQKELDAAVPFLQRARQVAKHQPVADSYLQAIAAEQRSRLRL
ncbi:MAG TPA: tetratricopeptide repeat protein [Gammaproteobacteria bacterium]